MRRRLLIGCASFSVMLEVLLLACSSTTEESPEISNTVSNTTVTNTTGTSTSVTSNTVSSSVSSVATTTTSTTGGAATTTATSSVTTGTSGTTSSVSSVTASSAGGASSTSTSGDPSSTTTGTGTTGDSTGLGSGVMDGSGTTMERYETAMVSRNDEPYVLITNGWGPGFGSHTISWEGTSFTVESLMGSAGTNGQPAGYPTVFCGRYSVMQVPDCGLPAPRDSITSLKTGWLWAPNGNEGEYNAAYDIWVGSGNQLQGYLMVWLRDPPSFQPAGSPNMSHQGVSVANVDGVWNIWDGTVNGLPIINWVRPEGQDSYEIEFDVMDFVRDAEQRGFTVPGSQINAVAVGFEIWEGPITGLQSLDFYVDVQ